MARGEGASGAFRSTRTRRLSPPGATRRGAPVPAVSRTKTPPGHREELPPNARNLSRLARNPEDRPGRCRPRRVPGMGTASSRAGDRTGRPGRPTRLRPQVHRLALGAGHNRAARARADPGQRPPEEARLLAAASTARRRSATPRAAPKGRIGRRARSASDAQDGPAHRRTESPRA